MLLPGTAGGFFTIKEPPLWKSGGSETVKILSFVISHKVALRFHMQKLLCAILSFLGKFSAEAENFPKKIILRERGCLGIEVRQSSRY